MHILVHIALCILVQNRINLQLEEYVLRDPLLFGDYRNALDEEEVRYYEDLLDYEAVYFLFQEVI